MKVPHRRAEETFSGTEEAELYDRRARAYSEASALSPILRLSYGLQDRQRIELYRPEAVARDPLPVLVFLHGGAWIAGGLEWLRFMAEAVTAQPAILAIASYRLAPGDKWPAQHCDAVEAVHRIRSEVEHYGGDPERMVVSGHSAGGHLAAMAALTGDIGPVRACMPVSSPMDLRYGRVASSTGKGRVYRYLLSDPEDDEGASPICFVAGSTTPFHLTWGENDFEHVRESGGRMVQALSLNGQAVECDVRPGAGHFDTHLQLRNPRDDWYRAFRAFVA